MGLIYQQDSGEEVNAISILASTSDSNSVLIIEPDLVLKLERSSKLLSTAIADLVGKFLPFCLNLVFYYEAIFSPSRPSTNVFYEIQLLSGRNFKTSDTLIGSFQ